MSTSTRVWHCWSNTNAKRIVTTILKICFRLATTMRMITRLATIASMKTRTTVSVGEPLMFMCTATGVRDAFERAVVSREMRFLMKCTLYAAWLVVLWKMKMTAVPRLRH